MAETMEETTASPTVHKSAFALAQEETLAGLQRLFAAELDCNALAILASADYRHAVETCLDAFSGSSFEALLDILEKANSSEEKSPFLEKRSAEYRIFFVGPPSPAVPLWESIYLDSRELLFLPSTEHVRKTFLRWGFEPNCEGRVPSDNLAFMLEFLARTAQSDETALIADRRSFEQEHLANWLPLCIERAQKAEAHFGFSPFYRLALTAALEFVEHDCENAREKSPSAGA